MTKRAKRIEKSSDIKWDNDVSEPLLSTEVKKALGFPPGPSYRSASRVKRVGRWSYLIDRQDITRDVKKRATCGPLCKWQFVLMRERIDDANVSREDVEKFDDAGAMLESKWMTRNEAKECFGVAAIHLSARKDKRVRIGHLMYRAQEREAVPSDGRHTTCRWLYRLVIDADEQKQQEIEPFVDHPDAYVAALENAPAPVEAEDFEVTFRDRVEVERLARQNEKQQKQIEQLESRNEMLVEAIARAKANARSSTTLDDEALQSRIQDARETHEALQECAQEIVAGASEHKTIEAIVMRVSKLREALDLHERSIGKRLLELTSARRPLSAREMQREQAIRMRDDGKSMLDICRLINRKHGTNYKPEHINAMLEEVA